MKYISEDNRYYSPTSMLVDYVYGRGNTLYSCGKDNLRNVINTLMPTDEEIIVYIDVVPGNPFTLKTFFNLLVEYKNMKNVYIVPILCTEACLIKSINDVGYKLPRVQKDVLVGNISYKETKYGSESNLERALKLFYKDLDLLNKDLSYYTDSNVRIAGKVFSKEERGVAFIVAHRCYLSNSNIEKYYESQKILLLDYIKDYINLYNRLAKANSFALFPELNLYEYIDER